MEKKKIDTFKISKYIPEKLDGRLVMMTIAKAAHEMQESLSLTAEERERRLYEALKEKYEKG